MSCVPGRSERLKPFDELYDYSRRGLGAENEGEKLVCLLQLGIEESR